MIPEDDNFDLDYNSRTLADYVNLYGIEHVKWEWKPTKVHHKITKLI